MRIHLISDLHLDHWKGLNLEIFSGIAADVTVVAGDLASFPHRKYAEDFLLGLAEQRPTLWVAGNHDFWGTSNLEYAKWAAKLCRQSTNLTFLDETWKDFYGVRFYGSTFWTDFNLYGDEEAARRAVCRWPDFYQQRGASPTQYQAWHRSAVKGLGLARASAPDKLVCVSHFVPHPAAIADCYRGNPANPYFCSDLSHLMDRVDAWLFGHTHTCFDFREGGCHLRSNPAGYPGEKPTAELRFDPHCVVVV